MNNYYKNRKRAFTLVETLVATAVFVMVSTAIYSGFVTILKIMTIARAKGVMVNLANEQFEIVRNLPYQSVGTVYGIPSGSIPQNQNIVRDSKTFDIQTVIRNVDESFDGTFSGIPKDISPADMKIIEVTITCESCASDISPISLTTKIAPKNLETASVNGALVVKVFDASGLPVSEADVNIVNNSLTPAVNITDMTDINGMLTLVDAPPSVSGYQIIVSKEGYSTDRTYPIGGSGNPNPTKPNVTVVIQQISQVSFTIDKTSIINVSAVNNLCAPTLSFDFGVNGNKIIGTSPDIIKYSNTFVTNSSGLVTLSNMEWDTYNITGIDGTYDIIGTNPLLSLGVNPDVVQDMEIITAPQNGRRLLVVVRDQSTGLPISDAIVSVTGPDSYSKSSTTSEGFLTQTDWSGGSGQVTFIDQSKYFSNDSNIEAISSPGNLSLYKIAGNYALNGNITSSTFDTGAASNFKQITWSPGTEPSQTGATSVRFQIATNNDNLTWNYLGPDGTINSFYTSTNQNINSIHSGNRYIRYRLYLSTLDQAYTPTISDISITYSSACVPPGQVSFSGLATGTYNITISKDGYQGTSKNTTISSNWSKEEMTISQ